MAGPQPRAKTRSAPHPTPLDRGSMQQLPVPDWCHPEGRATAHTPGAARVPGRYLQVVHASHGQVAPAQALEGQAGDGEPQLVPADDGRAPVPGALGAGAACASRWQCLVQVTVWPHRQGPFADLSDLQRALAVPAGFGPCHRASPEEFASHLVSLSHTRPTQIRPCDLLGKQVPQQRSQVAAGALVGCWWDAGGMLVGCWWDAGGMLVAGRMQGQGARGP